MEEDAARALGASAALVLVLDARRLAGDGSGDGGAQLHRTRAVLRALRALPVPPLAAVQHQRQEEGPQQSERIVLLVARAHAGAAAAPASAGGTSNPQQPPTSSSSSPPPPSPPPLPPVLRSAAIAAMGMPVVYSVRTQKFRGVRDILLACESTARSPGLSTSLLAEFASLLLPPQTPEEVDVAVQALRSFFRGCTPLLGLPPEDALRALGPLRAPLSAPEPPPASPPAVPVAAAAAAAATATATSLSRAAARWIWGSDGAAPAAGAVDVEVVRTNWYWARQRRILRFSARAFERLDPEDSTLRERYAYENVRAIDAEGGSGDAAQGQQTPQSKIVISFCDSTPALWLECAPAAAAEIVFQIQTHAPLDHEMPIRGDVEIRLARAGVAHAVLSAPPGVHTLGPLRWSRDGLSLALARAAPEDASAGGDGGGGSSSNSSSTGPGTEDAADTAEGPPWVVANLETASLYHSSSSASASTSTSASASASASASSSSSSSKPSSLFLFLSPSAAASPAPQQQTAGTPQTTTPAASASPLQSLPLIDVIGDPHAFLALFSWDTPPRTPEYPPAASQSPSAAASASSPSSAQATTAATTAAAGAAAAAAVDASASFAFLSFAPEPVPAGTVEDEFCPTGGPGTLHAEQSGLVVEIFPFRDGLQLVFVAPLVEIKASHRLRTLRYLKLVVTRGSADSPALAPDERFLAFVLRDAGPRPVVVISLLAHLSDAAREAFAGRLDDVFWDAPPPPSPPV